jgi:hypothetical protein
MVTTSASVFSIWSQFCELISYFCANPKSIGHSLISWFLKTLSNVDDSEFRGLLGGQPLGEQGKLGSVV